MSVFRPSVRVTDPDGREWEIYVYRLQLPERGTPEPAPFGFGSGIRAEAAADVLDGIAYIVLWLPRLLLRVLVDIPAAGLRALRSDSCYVEAISWAPFRTSYKWSTTNDVRGQVLVLVEGALARGETPHPRNAHLLEAR